MFGLSIVRTKDKPRPTHSADGTPLTPARQLALMQSEHAADGIMSAIKGAKFGAWLIVLIVMAVSYDDQRHYLYSIHARFLGQLLIPVAFDAATIVCVTVIGTLGMRKKAKVIALAVILFPVGASMYLNWMASPNIAVAVAYVMVVGLIPAIELLRANMGADFSTMLDTEETYLNAANRKRTAPFNSGKVRMAKSEWEARKRAGYHKMSRAEKLAWTRSYRSRVSRRVEIATPVSPPPAGQLRDLTPTEVERLSRV